MEPCIWATFAKIIWITVSVVKGVEGERGYAAAALYIRDLLEVFGILRANVNVSGMLLVMGPAEVCACFKFVQCVRSLIPAAIA